MVTVVSRVKANVNLSDYVTSGELARIMDIDKSVAHEFISGELSFEWGEFTELADYLEMDKSSIYFTIAEDAQISIFL